MSLESASSSITVDSTDGRTAARSAPLAISLIAIGAHFGELLQSPSSTRLRGAGEDGHAASEHRELDGRPRGRDHDTPPAADPARRSRNLVVPSQPGCLEQSTSTTE